MLGSEAKLTESNNLAKSAESHLTKANYMYENSRNSIDEVSELDSERYDIIPRKSWKRTISLPNALRKASNFVCQIQLNLSYIFVQV